MKQFNWHRRIGLAPGWGLVRERYGPHTVYIVRLGMAALTWTVRRTRRAEKT